MLKIKVLGSGCEYCNKLESLCNEVISENGLEAEVEKVTDYKTILSYSVMTTPALVINEKVISSGKIPTKSTLTHWIINELANVI